MNEIEVKVGQVWASTDKRDMEANHNQRRLVVDLDEQFAWLTTANGATRVRRSSTQGIKRHRRVR